MGWHRAEIELGMADPRTRGHALHVTGPYHGLRPKAILMRHFAIEDDGDDFHFLVGMRAEAGVRGDDVVIEHAQGAKLDIRRVIILAKRKQPVGLEPVKVRKVAFIGTNNVDHRRLLSLCLSSSLQPGDVCTTNVMSSLGASHCSWKARWHPPLNVS